LLRCMSLEVALLQRRMMAGLSLQCARIADVCARVCGDLVLPPVIGTVT